MAERKLMKSSIDIMSLVIRIFLENVMVTQLVKNFSDSTEPKIKWICCTYKILPLRHILSQSDNKA